MPAAAVIPAPIALLKVAAVKKLVVEYPASLTSAYHDLRHRMGLYARLGFTVNKLECSKQAFAWIF